MEPSNQNNICKIDFTINQQPQREADAMDRWRGAITKRVNSAALTYSRPFTDEQQRKHFMQGVAFGTKQSLLVVVASSKTQAKKRKE